MRSRVSRSLRVAQTTNFVEKARKTGPHVGEPVVTEHRIVACAGLGPELRDEHSAAAHHCPGFVKRLCGEPAENADWFKDAACAIGPMHIELPHGTSLVRIINVMRVTRMGHVSVVEFSDPLLVEQVLLYDHSNDQHYCGRNGFVYIQQKTGMTPDDLLRVHGEVTVRNDTVELHGQTFTLPVEALAIAAGAENREPLRQLAFA